MERGNNFFYVYEKGLVKHLRYDKGIEFNCTGLNIKSKDQFWQFTKSEALYQAVTAFMQQRKNK
ncbi:hypothetical protein AMS62_01715 [Bacillus sp. FJAT-18019]|nr:hypothetical protein AMS62_01715 [Bacillus sp. FJAT-18019]